MVFLPLEIENIILDFKYEMEHKEKMSYVLDDLVDKNKKKRKYIMYEYFEDIKYPALLIHNLKDTKYGAININFWKSKERKKYIKDKRIQHDVAYYAIFTYDGQTWWEY